MIIALGKDVMGNPYLADLEKMPHMLIAGATGSGKSVCLNTLLLSLIAQNTPEECQLLLVDPKESGACFVQWHTASDNAGHHRCAKNHSRFALDRGRNGSPV